MNKSARNVFADVKRFRERWIGDDRFREAILRDATAATFAAGLKLDPMRIAALWQGEPMPPSTTPEASALAAIEAKALGYLNFCASAKASNSAYIRWRESQKARCLFEFGTSVAPANPHLPFAIELADGCSVGCWFCGLSAKRLKALAPTNMEDWAGILDVLGDFFSVFASRGMLFWATDPLDHPNYEQFADLFRHRFGCLPTTTTALSLADVERTRTLIDQFRGDGGPGLRFSIISRRQLDEVHAAFDAEELAEVDMVLANRESLHGLAIAGRVREKETRIPARVDMERKKISTTMSEAGHVMHNSIACVSGFLINLASRRFRLITPTVASDRWPNGFAVLFDATFDNATGLRSLIAEATATRMRGDVQCSNIVQLARDLSISYDEPLLTFRAKGHSKTFGRKSGVKDLAEIVGHFRTPNRVGHVIPRPTRQILSDIATLRQNGVIIDADIGLMKGAGE